MKKLIVTTVLLACCTIWAQAQDVSDEELQVDVNEQLHQTFDEVWEQWMEFNNQSSDAAYSALANVERQAREECLNSELKQQLTDLFDEEYALLDEKAKELGFSSYKEAFASSDPRVDELRTLEEEYNNQRGDLTREYRESFRIRFEQAAIDAIQRMMENAEAVK
ncbi:MAG: hypothetical protein JW913_16270 [Chitinispirillaceae bacterium]|nr:hypothetical protein [Chitinispirillaceae bacterium]